MTGALHCFYPPPPLTMAQNALQRKEEGQIIYRSWLIFKLKKKCNDKSCVMIKKIWKIFSYFAHLLSQKI